MERKSYLDIVVQVVGSVAVLTILALLFFVLSALLEPNNAPEHEFISTESLRAAAPPTLKFVAGIMLTIAIAKFMFGLTSTKDYFGKNFKEIFLGLETSDILTKKGERKLVGELPEEMLEKVHYEIVKRKSNISFPYESSFFKTMSQSIEPLLGKIHYETFKIEIDNTIEEAEDGTRYIISERTIETELHTRTAGNYNLGINSRVLKFVPGFDPEDLYCLNNLLIDGEPEHVDLHGPTEIPGQRGYYSCDFPIVRHIDVDDREEGTKIEIIREETLVIPFDDYIRWTIAPDKSLRQITVNCKFNEMVHPKLWIFGIQRGTSADYRPKKPRNSEKKCTVTEWKGWMLPYHGFIIGWN